MASEADPQALTGDFWKARRMRGRDGVDRGERVRPDYYFDDLPAT
ncbi:hypothetical protein [Acidomonas methanolica]|nr:hypothetical protein [Acidomonas methanolica]